MDFLNGNIKTIYFKYLAAAFGSALITSIYSIVDMAMVGQYHGPEGSAALAVVAPVWNIIYSFGLLMGIGGSVLFSTIRGKSEGQEKRSNAYFTASVIGSIFLAAVIWLVVIFFDRELLLLFGAQDNTLSLAREYVSPIKFAIPLFLFNQMLAAYLRNDKNPALATGAVLAGGIFNVFGDYFFVFTCDMGAYGAGLATAIGSAITFIVMLSHFFTKRNTLHFVKPTGLFKMLKEISVTGFSTFFIDVAMGILTILFNRQIMHYLGTNALAVYGVIVNISTFAQCCAYSVGQASQPIISTNFGANKGGPDSSDLKICFGHDGLFRHLLDSIEFGGSQPVYPRLYDANARGPGNCSNDFPLLWHLVPFAAIEHLFYLLLPGPYEAQGGVCCVRGAWVGGQRGPDLLASIGHGGGLHLVHDAHYGAARCHLCRL